MASTVHGEAHSLQQSETACDDYGYVPGFETTELGSHAFSKLRGLMDNIISFPCAGSPKWCAHGRVAEWGRYRAAQA